MRLNTSTLTAHLLLLIPFATCETNANDYGVLDWIHNSDGGFVNPKQEFRHEDPDDPTSPVGMFAKERIEANEVLMKVPWDLMLKSDDMTETGQMCCGTVKALTRELAGVNRGSFFSSSPFAPYIRYLDAQPDGVLPSDWSRVGQRLLRKITGGHVKNPMIPPTEPTEWLIYDWRGGCLRGGTSTPLQNKAALLVVQKSDDPLMVPGGDLYNHRNGEWLNTETNLIKDKHQLTKATKTIEKGEQLYNSYNDCSECDGRKFGYGTPEIFRDYGFIENFPQRWHYMDVEIQFDLFKLDNGELEVKWNRRRRFKDDEEKEKGLVFFRQQIRRLRRIKNLEFPSEFAIDYDIPQNEWDLAWKFYDAHIEALKAVIHKVQEELGESEDSVCTMDDYLKGGACTNLTEDTGSHYDVFNDEVDDLDYIAPTCDNNDIMDFNDYDVVYSEKTNYQTLNFAIHPEDKDVCMDLDDIVQICSNYRPQYHEFSMHGAAKFLDSIKRVIFIGGGDSMLLHEALKYDDLELVVGLELDQYVTRQSFKYFKSQPHFDDERVEWWFGDATKSLLLLPKDYWQSFDLVLVDLSETAMSLTVTNELDVFDALALLLKPEGVMVKNELYMEHFSKVFDNTIQLYYDCPIICSQCMVMGSNTVDFLHDTPKDHGIETLLYETQTTNENRYDFWHDYRKSDPHAQGKCGPLNMPEEAAIQEQSAGITEIVEAENASLPLDEGIKDLLKAAITQEGFTLVTLPFYDQNFILITMKEGYVAARLWPEQKYCGFDINLWGSFHKLKSLRKALTKAVGSTLVSSYRIVVGGMYGSSTWKDDQKLIGPQIVQTRKCEEEEVKSSPAPVEDIVKIALDETVNLVHNTGLSVAVLCGTTDHACSIADLLEKHANVDRVVKFWTCPDLEDDDAAKQNSKMFECENNFSSQLNQALKGNTQADLFVVDSVVSYPMLQILNSVLEDSRGRVSWIKEHNVFVAISVKPIEEPWRSNFLDRYRKQYKDDPVARAEYFIQAGDATVQIGIVTCGDESLAYTLTTEERILQERFSEAGLEVNVELRTIHGGLFPYKDDFDGGNKFLQSDYDDKPGFQQYNQQQPLGSQHIVQINTKEGEKEEISSQKLEDSLLSTLEWLQFDVISHVLVADVGEGVVIAYTCKQGNVIVVWDGREHIDLNFFSFAETEKLAEKMVAGFIHYASRGKKLAAALRDDFPRGIGRVVNFKADLQS